MNMNDREKADTLLKIIVVGDRLAAFDREIHALYDRRTTIGQIAEKKKHFAEEQVEYHDAPDEPVSVSELIRSQQAVSYTHLLNIRICEDPACADIEVVVRCRQLDDTVLSLLARLRV